MKWWFLAVASAYQVFRDIQTDNPDYIEALSDVLVVVDPIADKPVYLKDVITQDAVSSVRLNGEIITPTNVLFTGMPPIAPDVIASPNNGVTDAAITLYRFYCRPIHPLTVGFSNSDLFAPHWRANGVFVTSNGNLAGSSLYQTGFATIYNEKADFIDLVVEVTNGSHVDIFLVVDDRFFGRAYSLDFTADPKAISSLRPMVQFIEAPPGETVAGVFAYTLEDRVVEEQWHQVSDRDPPFEGDWIAYSTDQSIPVELSIEPRRRTDNDDVIVQVVFKVINTAGASARFGIWPETRHGAVALTTVVHATKMLPPKDAEEFEQQVFDLLSNLATWELSGGRLILRSKQGSAAMFAPREKTPSTENPFLTS